MGLFTEWQPKYADLGIATFPVQIHGKDKKPAVSGYLKVGPDVSRQLALKFADNDSFGFALKKSRITVLDVDTPDERVLADALSRHGKTPFVVRTGSGHFQAWYRHNGERRRIRPRRDVPIDILGDGYVVAPPSKGARGPYEIIQGRLDDIVALPTMGGLEDAHVAAEAIPSAERIGEGKRNDTLFQICMKEAHACDDFDALLDVARTRNREFFPPLPDAEVVSVAKSAWGYTERGENRFGVGRVVTVEHDIVDKLAATDPHAFSLLSILKRHHWGRPEFVLAKSMATSLGWTEERFKAARDRLVESGLIFCIRPGGRGRNDPPVYGWRKGG